MKRSIVILMLFGLLFLLLRCKKEGKAPLITSVNVAAHIDLYITAEGIIYAEGDAPITEKGLCWSKSKNAPTVADNKISVGSGAASFTAQINNLEPLTTFYVRTYATNSFGTGYGDVSTLKTGKGPDLPLIINNSSYGGTQNSMIVTGSIGNFDLTGNILTAGYCWSTNGVPFIEDAHQEVLPDNLGMINATLTGLQSNTTYSVRAYAAIRTGTAYSSDVFVFKTANGTLTDYDNNVYQTIQIGDQIWMAENLRVKHYSDGTPITHITDANTWYSGSPNGAWCNVDDNSVLESKYGLLYDFTAAQNVKKIAPAGWHVPTQYECNVLINQFGGNYLAANALKTSRPLSWSYFSMPNINSGFEAVAAGQRDAYGNFSNQGYNSLFWLSTTGGTNSCYLFDIYNNSAQIDFYSPTPGANIRLIKD